MATLLVSDDDPQMLELVTLVLEGAGHTVLATSDPRAVFPMATESGVDAIILDINMPVSGFEVLSRLRGDAMTASLPILFLSGLAEGPDRVRGLREGADDYLVKPFEPAELVLRVERLVSWRRRAQQSRAEAEPGRRRGDPRRARRMRGPKRFGRYEVLDVIGKGAMGTVFRGWDPRLERQVALKTIHLESRAAERLEMLELLRREAVTIARFNQPNIIAVYDMGNSGDTAFIAMELVEGTSLRDVLGERGPLDAEHLVPVAAAVARGLAAAHARQVIHRDVKPGNVLLGRDGAIKVSDFGLAFIVSSMAQDSTEISGTPGYVPPEVMSKQPYTESGDLFGLGATLYEGLTGVHPLCGPSLRDTILNTLEGKFRPLADYGIDFPPRLVRLVSRLLDLDPSRRPSAAAVASELERYAAERDLRWSPELLPS